ncbi:MAG TPA: RusA family crossover junction endodeoxyribonuclease, partial [Candidatus Coatesbacteria bacterium]|nr:RusA family crossover junction endodeoxyribonuclease [Candidatus Coatesbacteria bacterium]
MASSGRKENMIPIAKFIEGVPYGQEKKRGNTTGLKEWSKAIREQTGDMSKVSVTCKLEVEFVLPEDKFPTDYPYGPDLDNLLKRFLDALNATIFESVKGKDSCVVSLSATKRKACKGEKTGARFRISGANID